MSDPPTHLIDGLPGKVLITGGGAGIGWATAVELLRRGYDVVATDLVAPEVPGADCRPLDVTDADAVRQVIGTLDDLGALVCSAGIGMHAPIERSPIDAARTLFDVNFFGALACAQAAVRGMRARGHGVIVNVSSNVARSPLLISGVYAASKAALNTVSQVLSYEAGRFGIRVHIVEPGSILTDFPSRRTRFGFDDPPYDELAGKWQGFLDRSRGSESFGPEVVASVIARIIEDPGAKFMNPGSPDAAIRAEKARGVDEEGWHQLMLANLGFTW
jgi:NAD(P)-dependent dehydrogenase (short-subunit alcohol dehydrogenase family)